MAHKKGDGTFFVLPYRAMNLNQTLNNLKGSADWVGLRLIEETTQLRDARNGIVEDVKIQLDYGIMVEVLYDGQFAYAGTSELTPAGISAAYEKALSTAKKLSKFKLYNFTVNQRPKAVGHFKSARLKDLDQTSVAEIMSLLVDASKKMKISDEIVSSSAGTRIVECKQHFVSSNGSDYTQDFLLIANSFTATAQRGTESQYRTNYGAHANCKQIGTENFDREKIMADIERLPRQALELLNADNCPTGTMDVVIDADQMLLQIHESIGHPLEYDRILGDERNYAGWSFVKPTDFGSLQYGSKMMNVVFDPTVPGETASYSFDDCGNPAKREYLIKDGVLQRGLGSLESQTRLNLPGVANYRSSSWNRAPIDRMANINLEAGSATTEQMISSIERGVWMESNRSWSIDDYRNKFQFGCEYGRLIENGKLTKVVKNPNYRGMTVPFWNSLKNVGDTATVFGSPFCGKGEPNQIIRVGHASPVCQFENIEVFGGG